MKKILTSIVFIAVFAGYALSQYLGSAPGVTLAARAPSSVQNAGATSNAAHSASPQASATLAVKKASQYTDGTYTGSVADAYYGSVQVQVKIAAGKIADVQFLQYPSDRSTSRMINSQAMPLLTQEAIQAQSANVSGVSGASDTSAAFQQSLTAALTLASV
jgi:uncharacterized protein with FMN-binding domain